tara:strand:+ start:851 stop:1213 length:363 start_codon:yes stop_codon:yes gene_type:complete
MGNRKNDEEENGVLDTIGEALSTVGKTLFDRGLSKEGLKEKAKEKVENKQKEEKPKRVKKPSGTKPTNVNVTQKQITQLKKQIANSPNGTSFFDMKEADLRKQRIAQRIADLKKRQEENK